MSASLSSGCAGMPSRSSSVVPSPVMTGPIPFSGECANPSALQLVHVLEGATVKGTGGVQASGLRKPCERLESLSCDARSTLRGSDRLLQGPKNVP